MSWMTVLFGKLAKITRADISPQVKWAVNLVIADGHFIIPEGFVWICMGYHTYFITPECVMNTLTLVEAQPHPCTM